MKTYPKHFEVIKFKRDFGGRVLDGNPISLVYHVTVDDEADERRFYESFDDGYDKVEEVKMSTERTLTHPKFKDLKVNIIKLGSCYYYDIDGDYYEKSWCEEPLEECIKDANEHLEYIYSGEAAKDRAEDGEYARQERFACGNY